MGVDVNSTTSSYLPSGPFYDPVLPHPPGVGLGFSGYLSDHNLSTGISPGVYNVGGHEWWEQ